MKQRFTTVRLRNLLFVLYTVLVIVSSMQSYLLKVKTGPGEPPRTKYNNYLIFKSSHDHLLQGKNLYAEYPYEHADLYKYSPVFALFMGFFARIPDWLGLPLWNLLNAAVFVLAVLLLPLPDQRKRMLVLLLSMPDVMTSLQNSQSNVLVAGLLILGLALFERNRPLLATLSIVATFYIKIFGLAGLALLLFYPEKKKSILYAAFWLVFLGILPVMATGPGPLMQSYSDYLVLLKSDQSASVGFSVLGVAKVWFGLDLPKTIVPMAALGLLLLPLLNLRKFTDYSHRILFFAALLTWMVIFNHKAESPTFIIATAPVFLWFFSRERTPWNLLLIGLILIFTSLSPTDLFPFTWRAGFFEPYLVKAVPCILVWITMVIELYQKEASMSNDY